MKFGRNTLLFFMGVGPKGLGEKMNENEYEKIERKLEEFLGIETGDLRDEIIEKAVWLRKDPSKFVAVRIFPDESYDIGIGQEGSYDGLDERFWFEFSLIEPWDLPEFETVDWDGEAYVNELTEEVFKDDDELLEAVQMDVGSGFYDKFEYEWKKFLRKFDEWYNALKDTERESE